MSVNQSFYVDRDNEIGEKGGRMGVGAVGRGR